jgi:acyl carrier protein
MSTKTDSLRAWIRELHDQPVDVADDTDLIATGLVTSLQFVSMVVEIERLHGERLEPGVIQVSTMRTLAAIDSAVFQGA